MDSTKDGLSTRYDFIVKVLLVKVVIVEYLSLGYSELAKSNLIIIVKKDYFKLLLFFLFNFFSPFRETNCILSHPALNLLNLNTQKADIVDSHYVWKKIQSSFGIL